MLIHFNLSKKKNNLPETPRLKSTELLKQYAIVKVYLNQMFKIILDANFGKLYIICITSKLIRIVIWCKRMLAVNKKLKKVYTDL